ncbi:LysR family transcriptional regulator (plasmid) [Leisingera sp. M527]|uniref:LysR family transcriptional regulator n=1 Tax=Leisingera sp. M527 TaxID=2867014 RepID=UPI0021A41DE7|nr:LysR family transcriptional regulator [Leisingera sp. M527]UWQ35329.1 LysR family transcriptional regulator [Leisingera sp. M527]
MEHRDLNDLATFAAIADTSSITQAAKKLMLPKSNVSRRLARLEDRLGVKLIERNTRSSRLTPIGVRYADYCRLMVEEANAADAVVEASFAEPTGELHVSASVLVGQEIIAPAIAAYVQEYPKVQVHLELSNERSNLIENGIDLAFRIGENQDSALMSQTIGTFPFGLFASPSYLRQLGSPRVPKDLGHHRRLIMQSGFGTSRWKLTRNEERVEVTAPVSVIANDFLTLRNLAVAGGGIAMLPTYAVHSECASRQLVDVLPEWDASNVGLSAIYPSRRGATLKQRAFIQQVKHVAENLSWTRRDIVG